MQNKTFLIGALVLVVIVVIGLVINWGGSEPDAVEVLEDPIQQTVEQPQPSVPEDGPVDGEQSAETSGDETLAQDSVTQPETPSYEFPESRGLDNSDDYLKEVLAQNQNLPAVRKVTEARHVIRRSVTAVDRVLRGENPNRQLSFLQPEGETLVELKGNQVFLSNKNYLRYEPLVDSLEEMDARFLVALYRHLSPTLVTAYDELGYGDQAWEVKVSQFISKVLAVQVPEGPVELQGSEGVYIFKDDKLESLPAFDKAFIRMGPENTRRVQRKFREIRQAMREM